MPNRVITNPYKPKQPPPAYVPNAVAPPVYSPNPAPPPSYPPSSAPPSNPAPQTANRNGTPQPPAANSNGLLCTTKPTSPDFNIAMQSFNSLKAASDSNPTQNLFNKVAGACMTQQPYSLGGVDISVCGKDAGGTANIKQVTDAVKKIVDGCKNFAGMPSSSDTAGKVEGTALIQAGNEDMWVAVGGTPQPVGSTPRGR